MQFKNFYMFAIAAVTGGFVMAHTDFIYVHPKNINEEYSVDFNFSLKNSPGTTINTWHRNEQASTDSTALSRSKLYPYDAGVSHHDTKRFGQHYLVQQLAKGLNHIVLNHLHLLAGTYTLVTGTTENTFRSKFEKGGN